MMDFLRRLAPPRDGDSSRAVAVLPSRFASEVPLRSVPSEIVTAADDVPHTPIAILRAADAEPARHTQTVATPPAPRKALDPVTIATTPPVSAAVPERPATARESMRPARPIHRPVTVDAPVPPLHRDAAPVATEQSPRAPVASTRPIPATARPTITPPPARPLSPQAVTARTGAREPPRPVIHVTIDRIDVRAPATPARAPTPTQPRAASPSVSLADYLRGGRR
jgi:hypothetical protein